MKNYWIQTDAPVATWLIDVAPMLAVPTALIELATVLASAGHREGILLPRDEGGASADPVDEMRRRFETEGLLAMCRGRGWDDASANLAWFGPDDVLVEGPVSDLGLLLRTLEPVADSIPPGFMSAGEAPVSLNGPRLRYDSSGRPLRPEPASTTISVTLYSDIWFPYVVGAAHPWADFERRFDNRELAHRHTPRLNAFLADARRAAERVGCTWQLAPEESKVSYRAWMSEAGVALDSEAPLLMPSGAEAVPWISR